MHRLLDGLGCSGCLLGYLSRTCGIFIANTDFDGVGQLWFQVVTMKVQTVFLGFLEQDGDMCQAPGFLFFFGWVYFWLNFFDDDLWSVWFSRLSTLDGSPFQLVEHPKRNSKPRFWLMDLGSLPWLHFVAGISWCKDLQALVICMHLCCILVLCRSIFGIAKSRVTPRHLADAPTPNRWLPRAGCELIA